MRASFSWSAAAWPRSVSRSSPKILIAICDRTPDSIWSMRWEIGWPMFSATGSVDEHPAHIGEDFRGVAPRAPQRHVEFADVHALGMFVELGAA